MTIAAELRDQALAFMAAYEEAIECCAVRTRPAGYSALTMPHAPFVAAPGLPPYDGVFRASYVETGICVRFDLAHARVPAGLAEALRSAHPELLGGDGALYEYERGARSQFVNRMRALARLAGHVRASGVDIDPGRTGP